MPGTLFGGLATARAASIAGRLQGEEQKRQQTLADRLAAQNEQDRQAALTSRSLQDRLTQTEIDKANQPPARVPYEPTTEDEAVDYFGKTHPATPRNIDPNSPEGIQAAASRAKAIHDAVPPEPPVANAQLTTVDDPNDPTGATKLFFAFDPKSQTMKQIPGGPTKTGTTGGGGLGGSMTPSAVLVNKKLADDADDALTAYENTHPNGPSIASSTAQAGVIGGTNAKGILEQPLGALTSGLSNTALSKIDPAAQAYSVADGRFAESVTNVLGKRFTDAQLALNKQLSMLAPNDQDAARQLKQQFRKDMRDQVQKVVRAPLATGGPSTGNINLGAGAPPPGTPEDMAAWAAQNPAQAGETREQYKARYAATHHAGR